MMMNIPTKNQHGFTLVELMIALVIFAVGILGVATMQLTAIKGNSKGRIISEVSNVAADQIEKIIAMKYDDISTAAANPTSVNSNYQVAWNVTANSPINDTTTIKVIVTPPNSEKNVEMTIIKEKDH